MRYSRRHPELEERADALALLTYEALCEVARLLGSRHSFPRVPPLSPDWQQDLVHLLQLEARESRSPGLDLDDE